MQKTYLSVPTLKAPLGTMILDLHLDHGQDWSTHHLNRLQTLYQRAPFFATYFPALQHWLEESWKYTRLADWNIFLIERLVDLLELNCKLSRSSRQSAAGRSTAYLIQLVSQQEGTIYHSGQGAKKYQDPGVFEQAGIGLTYNDLYRFLEHYPYPQQGETWLNGLSIVDALMHIGKDGILDLFRRYEEVGLPAS